MGNKCMEYGSQKHVYYMHMYMYHRDIYNHTCIYMMHKNGIS